MTGSESSAAVLRPCPVCGGESRFSFRSGDRLHEVPGEFDYAECTDCHAVFQTPTPTGAAIAAFYPDEYSPHRVGKTRQRNPLERAVLRARYGYRHLRSPLPDWLGRMVGLFAYRESVPFVPGGRMLDVGCGGGTNLRAMQSLGWEPHGVDFSALAVQTCRQSGLDVFHGELSQAGFPDGAFDLVSAHHVIEHVADPAALLREVFRIVKPGGMLLLRTPNSAALGRGWFGTDWYANDVPRHLTLFAPDNLALLAENAGFERCVIRTSSTPKVLLNSLDYRRGARSRNSRSRTSLRMLARIYMAAAAITGRGDEIFATFRKPASGESRRISRPALRAGAVH
jgi:2-polyprenyl-3-methyl-5-hydroxy-6-metoxy-1,4-benzoquinol methylase